MNQTQISVNHRQIGYRIKEVREQNHISQAQLAEMTDLSVSYISHIENAKRKASLESVRYAADRIDDKVKFTDEALMTILGVPRVFLSTVLKGCVDWARENNVELITEEHMKIINDKRSKEKSKKK